MDFIFVSMPYAKFDSKWFANVPNINLGLVDAFLTRQGKKVKTFHFHLAFLPFLTGLDPAIRNNLAKLSEGFGVEYLSLDYVFASLLFEDHYRESIGRFEERLEALKLTLDDFEGLRAAVPSFTEFALSHLSPYLADTKLVGFSCSHYQLSGALLMCALIKQGHPHVATIVGGKDCAGAFSRELLSCVSFVDFVGVGECEVTIVRLLEYLRNKKKTPRNVAYKDGYGRIRESKLEPNFSLNDLPSPEYHLDEFPVKPAELILPVELGRGCPWGKCTFCPDESYGVQCQSKTAGHVKEEMDGYQSISKDLKNFIILDPDALKDRALVVELGKYLQEKNFSFHFAEFRAERMDREVLASILRFGHWVSHFQVGIESFSDRILQLMNKGVSALRNVEVLKMVTELGVPLQFNLFTCYPNMTLDDLNETLRVMDLITHILVCENILIYPGEFYLPTDCPVFLRIEHYNLERNMESIFSDVFEGFPMPSYSNYPYPYQFDNQEEQLVMAEKVRAKVEEIKRKKRHENFMCYEYDRENLRISVCRDGDSVVYVLKGAERDVYASALERSQPVTTVSERIGISPADLRAILQDFEKKGLILYSGDRASFFSLATRCQ